jgi:hypothetical protein
MFRWIVLLYQIEFQDMTLIYVVIENEYMLTNVVDIRCYLLRSMKHNHQMMLEEDEDKVTMDSLMLKHAHKNEELEEELKKIYEVD